MLTFVQKGIKMKGKKRDSWKSAMAGALALLMISGNLPLRVYASDTVEKADTGSADASVSDFTIENGVLTAYKGESKNVVIPDGVKVIGDGSPVFGNTVESVTIPTSATEIAEMAFYGCSALKSVTFAEESQLKKIGESAFYTATSLERLTIPEGVTEIGTNAFYATHALREINLPASLTTVCGGDWFGKLFTFGTTAGAPQSLSAVNFADGNSVYSSHDGVVYSADGKTLIYCPAKKTSIDWLAGVETIKTDSFFRSTIADLQIPEGVTTIEENAFKFCAATSAIFPSTLKSIGRMAFYSSKLNSIIFSEGLETIAASAFDEVYFSKDGSITLPASLISVGSSAFGCVTDSGKKVAVTVLGSGTELGSYFIPNSGNITLIGYPGSTAEAYANALGDNKNLTFKLIGGSEEKEIESVTLPASLEIKVGETSTLTAVILPEDASDKTLTWSSSDENVATVDENGKVTAVKAGNAVITATASNNVSASCELTVAEISDFTITDGVLTGYTGAAKNVIIPDGVKVIGEGSSVFGSEIESVTIPASVTEIAEYAFYGCSGLKSVTFAEGSELKKIGGSAFYAANSLETLTIPDGVTEIGSYAFCAMSRLRTISLPASLKNVCGGEWFGNLFSRGTSNNAPENLMNINFADGGDTFSSYDGAVYSADGKTLIYSPAAKKSLEFAKGVETIGQYALWRANLTSMTLPDTVKTIESGAFNRSQMTKVEIPGSVETIGSSAFFFANVSNLVLNEGLIRIEDAAFSQSHVAQVTIPASVTYIGETAFDFEYGSDYFIRFLGKDTVLADEFIPYYYAIKVYAPSGSTAEKYVADKKTAKGDSCKLSFHAEGFVEATAVKLDKTTAELRRRQTLQLTATLEPENAQGTISWSSSDTSVATVDKNGLVTAVQSGKATITASVGTLTATCEIDVVIAAGESDFLVDESGVVTGFIGVDASELVIPSEIDGKTVTGIAASVFKDNRDITKVTLPESVKAIGEDAFAGCSSLTEINLENVTSIGKNAFGQCRALTSVRLGEGLTVIPESAFTSCATLSSVTLPSTIKEIGKNAFTLCAFKSIELPEGLTAIRCGAFRGTPLAELHLPASLEKFGDEYMGDVFEIAGSQAADKSLENITIDEKNLYWTSVDGMLYSKDLSEIVFCPRGRKTAKVLDSVTTIGRYAFFMCFNLTKVELPAGLKTVSEQAFHYCEALVDCVLPAGLERVENSGFFGCEEWTGVDDIPSSVTFIGEYAFAECKGTKLVIPEGNTSIGKFAFYGYEETLREIVLPSTLRTLGDSVFSYAKNVKEIVIPEGVTSIGDQCFGISNSLESLILPSTLKSIGEEAFKLGQGTENKLSEVYIPSSVTSIASNAFSGRDGIKIIADNAFTAAAKFASDNGYKLELRDSDADFEIVDGVLKGYHGTSTDIVIPSTVTEIGEGVFVTEEGEEGVEISKVTIPSSVVRIGKDAFNGCELTSVVFEGENLAEIGESAFAYCTKLPEITLPEGLKVIGKAAFQGTSAIKSINIPASVESIGESAFNTCSELTEVNFADDNKSKLKTIGKKAFYQCVRLGTLDIPEGVTTIGDQAFRTSAGLKHVYLPSTLTNFGTSAPAVFSDVNNANLSGTDELLSITVEDGNPVYSSKDGLLYTADGETLLFCPSGITGTVTVADGTKTIGSSAFQRSKADHVVLHETLQTIGSSAFKSSGFASVEIPDSVTSIGYYAFFNCNKLKSVGFGQNLRTIEDGAFSLTPLENASLPASLESIGDDAFDSLKNYVRIENPGTVLGNGFISSHSNITVYGHSGSTAEKYVNDAKTRLGDSCGLTFKSIDAFVKVTKITLDKTELALKQREIYNLNVTIEPDNATHKDLVYKSLDTKLATVDENGKITALRPGTVTIRVLSTDGVYADCVLTVEADESLSDFLIDERGYITGYVGELTDLVIPASVENRAVVGIAAGAFADNRNITSLVLPDTLKEIESRAFSHCVNLGSVTFGSGLEVIGERAFEYCTHLPEVNLPEGLVTMGDYAFDSCERLERITIPSTLTEIPDGAFHLCWRLIDVVIPEGVETVGSEAFYECEGMRSLTLPNSLRTIKSEAFAACVRLTSVVVPEGVRVIENQAFMSCTGMTGIHLPATLEKLGGEYPGDAFERSDVLGCNHLTSVNVTAGGKYFSSKDGLLYNADGSELIFCPRGLTDVTIPEGVERIGDHAFFYCRILERVSLPSTLTELGANSFGVCEKLTSIVIPDGVTSIGNSAFASSASLNEVTLPSSLVTIGDTAFLGTALRSVVIPGKVETIGREAFAYNDHLTEATILKNVKNLGEGIFRNSPNVTVFTDSKDAPVYQYATSRDIPVRLIESDKPDEPGIILPVLDAFDVETVVSDGGKVVSSRERAYSGTRITLTVTPDDGYTLVKLTVTGDYGEIAVISDGDNWHFTMPASDVKVSAEFAAPHQAFVDVPEDAYYADAVDWAVRNGITNGVADGIFAPDASCTRAQAVTFLWRAAGAPVADADCGFADVDSSDYYYDAVVWAVTNGITNGVGDGLFAPDEVCTRAQIVTFLYRMAGSPKTDGTVFGDVAADSYYASAVSWAVSGGVTNGVGNDSFAPDNICTRAQIVTLLYRYAGI